MAITANASNVTKRSDVSRRLSYTEMDSNFEQLKLLISDTDILDDLVANKLDTTVYQNKINQLDQDVNAMKEIVLVDDRRGDTVNRPTLGTADAGFQYYDLTLRMPIWWDGFNWTNAMGSNV